MSALTMDPELGQEVPVASIDKELRKLWEADQARSNASLINLVTCSEEPGSLRKNSEIIRKLTQEHACRAILVEFDRAVEEPSIRAWITAHCHLYAGQKSVCCEQIAFAFTGRVTGRFRNTVFAHLNSDLPLVMWWQGELTSVLTERLSSVIDRLVVDSSSWSDPGSSYARLQEVVEDSNLKLTVHDLAWSRTWQFRLALAALFDEPVALDALGAMQSVRIVHHPRHRSSALQLLAWLSLQAGWRTSHELDLSVGRRLGATESFSFDTPAGTPVAVTVEADENAEPLGLLELSSPSVTLRISREPGASHLVRELICDGVGHTSLAPADPDDAAGLVGSQLSRGGKNTLFRKVLPRFLGLLAG
jgi:glucose-6-phosphate dehydrogenase assembly protein OpcA